MQPAIHNGLVLHAPLEHPERLAAGMADVSDCELRYSPFRRDPWWKIGLGVCAMGLLGFVLIYGELAP